MTSVSTSAQFLRMQANNLQLQQRLAELSEQVSTQKKSTDFAGLGSGARVSITLRGELTELKSYIENIDAAKLRLTTQVEAMERINQLAKDLSVEMIKLQSDPNANAAVVNDIARRGYDELVSLMNTQVQGRYVFAGGDSGNPPLPSAGADALFAQVAADLNAPVTNAAASFATTHATVAQRGWFSTTVDPDTTTPPVPAVPATTARIDRGLDVQYGVTVTNGTLSDDVTLPGDLPYFREVLHAFAAAANIDQPADPTNAAELAEFRSYLQQTQQALDRAAKTMDAEIGGLGSAGERMDAVKNRHKDMEVVLKRGLGDVEDVDAAEVITKFQLTQALLEASYRVTSTLNRVTLNDFL